MGQAREDKVLTPPVTDRDHIRGPLSAAVTLVEYGDYACLYSGQAYTAVKEELQRFGSQLRFIYRNFPVTQLNAQAQYAAEAAEAACGQNRFWDMHDMLFEHQQALENGFLVEYADRLRLDTTRFLRDMSQHIYGERVRSDFLSGIQSGVNRTPTFFLNGVRYDAVLDFGILRSAIADASGLDPGPTALLPHG